MYQRKLHKLLSCMLVMLMLIAMPVFVSAEEVTLAPITEEATQWSTEKPGTLTFDNPYYEQDCFYYAQLSKDGRQNVVMTYHFSNLSFREVIEFDFAQFINESGEYAVTMKVSPYDQDSDFTEGAVTEIEKTYQYVAPAEQLAAPTNIVWDSEGNLSWDLVPNAVDYFIEMNYLNDDDNYMIAGTTCNGDEYSLEWFNKYLKEDMTKSGAYQVRIQSLSKNIEQYQNSEWSEYSDSFITSSVTGDIANGLSDSLDKINSNTSTAEEVLTEIKNTVDKDNLALAMQTDYSALENISQIESKYAAESNITTSTNVGEGVALDTSKIALVGASLNAPANNQVKFSVETPSEEAKLKPNSESYKNTVQFSMNLMVGEIPKSELDIPITITMPIPEGIAIEKLVILHYAADGSYQEVERRINGDGTVTFTVTHFSEFVFAEAATPTQPDTTTPPTGATGGTTVTPDTTWKPTTEDELYRFSFMGPEVVSFTSAVADHAYDVAVENSSQGPEFFKVVDAVKGDYKIARTYNILPLGQTIYNMDQAANITLAIPETLQKDGRTFEMICVSVDGSRYVLPDLDLDAKTITFETSNFYAFALCYKD